MVRFSEDIRSVTELKSRASEIVNQAERTKRPVLLTRRGKGVAVILELDSYEQLVDRRQFVRAVETGATAAQAGDLHPHTEAEEILASFGERGA